MAVAINEDVRVKVTKDKVRDALGHLLRYKDVGDVSVTELCELAQVHRTTFYHHYQNVAEVAMEIEQLFFTHLKDCLQSENGGKEHTLDALCKILSYLKCRPLMTRSVMAGNGWLKCQQYVIDMLKETADNYPDDTEDMNAWFRPYSIAGTIAIIYKWSENDFSEDVEKIGRMIFNSHQKVVYGIAGNARCYV